jgi:hypothetical protein
MKSLNTTFSRPESLDRTEDLALDADARWGRLPGTFPKGCQQLLAEQQAAVTVRYMRAEQQASVAVEPLRLTCASSGADSAAAATAAIDVSSASFVAPGS